jgi:hypothetical protein
MTIFRVVMYSVPALCIQRTNDRRDTLTRFLCHGILRSEPSARAAYRRTASFSSVGEGLRVARREVADALAISEQVGL